MNLCFTLAALAIGHYEEGCQRQGKLSQDGVCCQSLWHTKCLRDLHTSLQPHICFWVGYYNDIGYPAVSVKDLCVPSGRAIGDADLMPYLHFTRAPTHLQMYPALSYHGKKRFCMAIISTFRSCMANCCTASQ